MYARVTRLAPILSLPLLLWSVASPASASADPVLSRLLQEAIESDSGFEDRFDAQVWLLDMSRRLEKFVKNPQTRIELLKRVHYEARRVGIEPELVLAVIEVESRFDEFAISVAGARGLMQVMPFWLDEIGISDQNLFKILFAMQHFIDGAGGCQKLNGAHLVDFIKRHQTLGSIGFICVELFNKFFIIFTGRCYFIFQRRNRANSPRMLESPLSHRGIINGLFPCSDHQT